MKKLKQALDSTGRLVAASQARGGQDYHCPDCGRAVRLCRGKQKGAYFAHCRGGTALPGETALHQRGKQQLAAWAHSRGWQPRLEVYLPAIQQRADLLVTIRGRQVALEFQCSGLSCQRLAARNAGYRRLGIHPVWLLGPAYRRSLRAAKRAQFTQLRGGRPVLLYWQVETGRLLVEEGRIAAQAQPVVGDSLRQLARLRFGLSQTAAGRRLQTRLYQAGKAAATCPLVAHCRESDWPLVAGPLFYWHLNQLLWLTTVAPGHRWSGAAWEAAVSAQTPWLPLPCLQAAQVTNLRRQLIAAWTSELVAAGILARQPAGVCLRQAPVWFPDLVSKQAALQRLQGKKAGWSAEANHPAGEEPD